MSKNQYTRLEHFKGYEELIRRIDDLCNQYNRFKKARLTPFLTPNEIEIVKRYLGNNYDYHFEGGYLNAECQRLIIGNSNAEIDCLVCDINNKNIKITHKDLLGAITNCGLKREMFGDIFIVDNLAVVYCTSETSQYVIDNVTSINRLNVIFHKSEAVENKPIIKEFQDSISSFRLDSIVSCICHISRAKAAELIKHELVSINYMINVKVDYLVKINEIISVRKYGKYVILDNIATTKKGRILIRYGKYQ